MKIEVKKDTKVKVPKLETKTLLSYSLPYLVLCILTIIFVAIVQYYLVIPQSHPSLSIELIRLCFLLSHGIDGNYFFRDAIP